MSETIGWAALAAAIGLAPFYLLLASVLVAAILGRRDRKPAHTAGSTLPRFLIVIPAHDEETLIGTTVRSCRAQDYPASHFAVHVIADNCSDRTADRAREAGAQVFERSNLTLKSKGHALEEFFATIPDASTRDGAYDAVVIVDADTDLDGRLLGEFAEALALGQDWIQAYYTVSNADASWRTRLMTYAFSLANGVWMLGLDRLGFGVGLKGNGMCFSRRGLGRYRWRAHGLVEDMEFALMLRAAGERVHFRKSAIVRGEIVSRGGPAAVSQRLRWEAGRKALRNSFREEIRTSRKLGLLEKTVYLIDLYFPPLGQLALITTIPAFVLMTSVILNGSSSSPSSSYVLATYGAYFALLTLYALSPILAMGLPKRYMMSLIALPYYLSWRALKTVGRKPAAWVRTPREKINQI
jgi:1,2-diacylglycerol 3-beta-glucosyltransferase